MNEISVLDKGFVRLVDHMGDDSRIVQSARVSYADGTKSVRKDKGLIDFLTRHKHTSPIEQVDFVFHIKIPLFVFAQLVRHRTASLNAQSARYSIMKDEFYIPNHVREQDENNKQGSNYADGGEWYSKDIQEFSEYAYRKYEEHLEKGVAREMARMILPQNLYTELYWKQNLHNLLHLIKLRMDPHAQWEIQQYANAIYEIIEPIVPFSIESWENHTLNSINFSGDEKEILSTLLSENNKENIEQLIDGMDVSKGRKREIKEKMFSLIGR